MQVDPGSASSRSEGLPGITLQNGFRLRRGQRLFLEKLYSAWSRGERSHLGVMVPGYGKTITGIASYLMARQIGLARRLVVLVPRANLRDQYADRDEMARTLQVLGGPPLAFCVADSGRVFLKNTRIADVVIATYQYALGKQGSKALERYCRRHATFLVLDEVHHLAIDSAWAAAVGQLPCQAMIGLSGTPVRSDEKELFGMPQETQWIDGKQVRFYRALHEVSLREAHSEGGILKRVEAHLVDYLLRLVEGDTGREVMMALSELKDAASEKPLGKRRGEQEEGVAVGGAKEGPEATGAGEMSAGEIDAYLARRRLRFHVDYLRALVEPGVLRMIARRRRLASAGVRGPLPRMLCLAMSNRHGQAILEFARARYPALRTERIGQDLSSSHCDATLTAFREGTVDILVSVDMVGEGTDIKPISVIVKADLVRARPKTLQQVFRGMRYVSAWPEEENVCDVFASSDAEVEELLRAISEEAKEGYRERRASQKGAAGTLAGGEQEPDPGSAWDIHEVGASGPETHALGLDATRQSLVVERRMYHDGGAVSDGVGSPVDSPGADGPAWVRDLSAEESELRRCCQRLAARLCQRLQQHGRRIDIADIHARAKRKFGRGHGEMSIVDLQRKMRWLERCLAAESLL